mmetsp:Transcript_117574/g.240457  ORF Transcript_117574/g.240457 Transcript_117574/m.240457 type:complete len:216 (-) Transcript_117574:118-765(-)
MTCWYSWLMDLLIDIRLCMLPRWRLWMKIMSLLKRTLMTFSEVQWCCTSLLFSPGRRRRKVGTIHSKTSRGMILPCLLLLERRETRMGIRNTSLMVNVTTVARKATKLISVGRRIRTEKGRATNVMTRLVENPSVDIVESLDTQKSSVGKRSAMLINVLKIGPPRNQVMTDPLKLPKLLLVRLVRLRFFSPLCLTLTLQTPKKSAAMSKTTISRF